MNCKFLPTICSEKSEPIYRKLWLEAAPKFEKLEELQASLESERSMNAELTKEVQRLEQENAALREALTKLEQLTNASWESNLMKEWDRFRKLCKEYPSSSLPREAFEAMFDDINDIAREALAAKGGEDE